MHEPSGPGHEWDDDASAEADEDASDAQDPPESIAELQVGSALAHDEAALKAWLGRIVRQDQEALADLYGALIGRVYGLIIRIVQDAPTAEEVAEDTFWQVWRQAPRFDPERGRALTWVLMIARSRALDALRLRRRLADSTEAYFAVDPESLSARLEPVPDGGQESRLGGDPCDLLEVVQDTHQLRQSLERLEPLARQMVALAFFRGLTHQEISEHTGIPLGTVKSHIRRALVALRGWMESAKIPRSGPLAFPFKLPTDKRH